MEETTVELRDNYIIIKVPRSLAGNGLQNRADAEAIAAALPDAIAQVLTAKPDAKKAK